MNESSDKIDEIIPERMQGLTETQRRKAKFVVLTWVAFIVALWVFPGSGADGFVLCPFRFVTGHSCPGCGMTRACTAAVRGDFLQSLSYHPLGILLILGFGASAMRRLWELKTNQVVEFGAKTRRRYYVASIGILIFVVVFGGLRFGLELAGILTPV